MIRGEMANIGANLIKLKIQTVNYVVLGTFSKFIIALFLYIRTKKYDVFLSDET